MNRINTYSQKYCSSKLLPISIPCRPVSRNSIKMTSTSEAPSEADSAMSQVTKMFTLTKCEMQT